MSFHLPSLTDAGHDAHQIRRAIERAYTDCENARLRSIRRGALMAEEVSGNGLRDTAGMRLARHDWTVIQAELASIMGRLERLRTLAEYLRRIHTPPQYRSGAAAAEPAPVAEPAPEPQSEEVA